MLVNHAKTASRDGRECCWQQIRACGSNRVPVHRNERKSEKFDRDAKLTSSRPLTSDSDGRLIKHRHGCRVSPLRDRRWRKKRRCASFDRGRCSRNQFGRLFDVNLSMKLFRDSCTLTRDRKRSSLLDLLDLNLVLAYLSLRFPFLLRAIDFLIPSFYFFI